MKKLLFLIPAMLLLGQGCPISNPSDQAPTNAMPEQPEPMVQESGCTPKALMVTAPLPGAHVTLPLSVNATVDNEGHPDCHWTVFEAQAGVVQLLDKDGIALGSGTLTTSDDWMTDAPVDYAGEIPALSLITPGPATLVITEENPSDLNPSQIIEIPLVLDAAPAMPSSE